jgi:hypothetical protein
MYIEVIIKKSLSDDLLNLPNEIDQVFMGTNRTKFNYNAAFYCLDITTYIFLMMTILTCEFFVRFICSSGQMTWKFSY